MQASPPRSAPRALRRLGLWLALDAWILGLTALAAAPLTIWSAHMAMSGGYPGGHGMLASLGLCLWISLAWAWAAALPCHEKWDRRPRALMQASRAMGACLWVGSGQAAAGIVLALRHGSAFQQAWGAALGDIPDGALGPLLGLWALATLAAWALADRWIAKACARRSPQWAPLMHSAATAALFAPILIAWTRLLPE